MRLRETSQRRTSFINIKGKRFPNLLNLLQILQNFFIIISPALRQKKKHKGSSLASIFSLV